MPTQNKHSYHYPKRPILPGLSGQLFIYYYLIMRKLIFCTTFLLGCLATTFAQDSLVVAKKASDRVQLFLDCTTWDCFDTYLKTEVQFVDFVRDRHLADVHIMITTQATGSGGTEYTLSFLGQDRFKDDNQTVRFFKKTTDSEQLEREGLSRTLKMGLLHYVAQTAMATEISVNYSKQSEETTAVKTDPWKNWVYSISLSGWTTGEARFNSLQTFGSLDADRVTEDWKINIGASFNYNESSFVISDGIFTSVNKGQYLYGSAVRSWGKKWAYGGKIRLAASSYSN
ncbi:MAG: hypothetical protein RI894_1469, partial [Bacteroidota bacterium]